jgi:DNA repair protein RadA/Sms
MAKTKSKYVCNNCGAESSVWAGKCFSCGEWNTLEEMVIAVPSGGGTGLGQRLVVTDSKQAVKADEKRLKSGLSDVDVVLGGGVVTGSVILLAGEPGIGKSTLLLQLADAVAAGHAVLYVSGEESVHQVGLRAKRLGAGNARLQIASSTRVEDIEASIQSGSFDLVVVDSIQTIGTNRLTSSPGSVSQITSCTTMLMQAAKTSNTALLLVGHVTKEGSIAGPKLLEHIVDVVLQLEGDRYGGFKVLRGMKNRFGSTNEVAILEMNDKGMQIVDNPSKALLAERQITDGSVVLATMEGSRPILVEVQALVNKTSYGYPKRTASGIDLNRLNLLVAMLERRTKLNLSDKDIYINIVGGIRVTEPAADLAICMAIGSASKGLQLKQNAAVFGEVGLSGEVRQVPYIEKRIAEAKKMGLEVAIGPKPRDKSTKDSLLHPVKDVRTALNTFLED